MMFRKNKESGDKFYITTAIDYVNSTPHIGTAYEKIAADVISRWMRLKGANVHLQMGNDEHSLNVMRSAIAAGLEPEAYCDQMEEKFTSVWKNLNISYDDFIRTTEPRHKAGVQKLFKTILDTGDIYRSTYEGWYCESCEAFLTDKDLVDKKCPNHKTEPKWLKEDNYFFKLSKYQQKLLDHIKKHPEFVQPEVRRNEVVKMIEMGLQDISISRSSVNWGIPLPNDPDHVVYVWFDALMNYITAVGFGSDEALFKKWWPANCHVIGKDIIRFHCVIWPAMLMSAGIALPKTVMVHGFVYLKGEKMSKSLGNVVTPLDITKDHGEDPLRYFLLRAAPFGQDTDFTWETFINRYNGDLANGIGNLVSRTTGMITQYLSGEIPASEKPAQADDKELKERTLSAVANVEKAMQIGDNGVLMNQALAAIWEAITAADKYINENKPWELKKAGNTDRIRVILSNVAETVRIVSLLAYSFIPGTAEKIWEIFGFSAIAKLSDQKFHDAEKWGFISKPINLGEVKNLFPRIEEKKEAAPAPVKKEKKEEKKMTTEAPIANETNVIDISDFAKVELRIAEVLEAEKVEGADKLLKLQINIGTEKRQIVAGIAKHYAPEDLIGKKIAVVVNLKPAKLRGIESQGMLLAASSETDVSILTPLRDVPAGSKIK